MATSPSHDTDTIKNESGKGRDPCEIHVALYLPLGRTLLWRPQSRAHATHGVASRGQNRAASESAGVIGTEVPHGIVPVVCVPRWHPWQPSGAF